MGDIRKATESDVGDMELLASRKREEYERYEAVMWRRAPSADETHRAHLRSLMSSDRHICLVHDEGGSIDAFITGSLHDAPPVYDPGGLTCTVDDFVVEDPESWVTSGRELLRRLQELASKRGAIQTIVVCSHRDEPKRLMLASEGFSLASEWYVR